ncbi:hypothetical protein [Tepidibacter aestuarii]|uniref:hypothetical protein n=1 Tax=Tepidibacter aestuarii TaxID=2925782 RepID=UPI0020BD8615|nr:hypothetical protein [Tepidibacter aestuarii]CAH2212282.1 conserved exported protein of unknown function [Tepidibacter aestuarii]
MKTNSRVRKLLSGVLIGGTLLSSVAGVAFANELSNLNLTNKASFSSQMNKAMDSKKHDFKQKKHDIKKDIDTLVEKGIITQEEADKMKELQEQKRAEMQEATKDMTKQERFEYMKQNKPENKGGIFSELVEQGSLTQERADEIQDKIHQMKVDLNKQKHEERINKLVEYGIITQEEADKIKDFQEQKRAKMQEATKDMTKEEKFEYMKQNKPENKGGIFAELVEQGLLTQQRADEIQDKMHQMKEDLNKQKHEERINKLVEDGIITQDEADKWTDFRDKKAEERQVEMEKIKDMTQEERKEYFKENHKEKGEGLTELVEAGIISQDTADKIKENHQNDNRGNRLENGQRPEHEQGNRQGKMMKENL